MHSAQIRRRSTARLLLAATFTAVTCGVLVQTATANTYDWSGATNGNMSGTAANWGGTVPTSTDIARWNSATYTTPPTANATMTIGELLFDAGNTGGVTFGAGTSTLTLNGISGTGIQLNSGSGAVSTGSAKFSLGGDQTWLNNSANTLTVGGTITNASTSIARTLTVDGSGGTILSGIISNNSTGLTTVTKTGSGTLTLGGSSANTFTGGLNVRQGTVKLAGSNSAGAGAGLVTIGSVGNSAVLDLNGASRTINSLATAGTAANQTITNSGATAATVNYTGATTSTFGGVIENGSGGGTTAVILNNAGANLTLSGANTYTGLTTVTSGTLKLGAATAIVSGNALTTAAAGTLDLNGNDQTLGTLTNAGTVTNSGGTTKTLTFGSASSTTSAGNFTGAMNVILNSSINNTLSGSWSNTGNITFNAISTNTTTVSTGTVNNTGTITTSGAANPTIISANIGANVGLITQGSSGSLALSGTNTNVGGVTVTSGTLKLGSTTALGATASTLTIGAGTALDSTVANLILANNNAQNWNGDFTFTGTNSLNLGTGAVTLAAPLTVTTTANTLTVGGTISGGTIFDITKAGAGTLVYNGNTTLTSAKTVNATAGTVSLGGTVSGGYGLTVNSPVTLALSGAGGNAATSNITVNTGASLAFDSSTAGVTGTTRAASTTLKGGSLTATGNATANSVDTLTGALTLDAPSTFGSAGASTVTATAGAMNAQLAAGSLVRANNGTVYFRGTNLGQNTIASNTAGASNISFSSSPSAQLVGGGGLAGTQNISILPWAVGSTAATGVPTSFVTYDANGIRPLSAGEYDTAIPAAASTNNVKLSAASPVTVNGSTTVNALFLSNAASSTTIIAAGTAGSLTVTSGAIYADLSLGGNNNVLTISKPVDFGAAEGVIGTMGTSSSKTLSFSGGISGSGGITIYDTAAVSSTQAGVNLGAANTYTGNTIINGQAIAANPNALPNFTNGGRTGDVYVNGTLGLSGSSNQSVRMNGLWGNGRIITPFSNNETLIVGDNNATSTFDGTITQTTGAIGLTKIGTGALTLTGTGSTWTAATNIQNGTLSVVTLNNVAAPNTSSSLGRPVTVANGTIGLGATTTTGTLKVVGTGETTDRVINLAGTTGGGTLDQSGTGLLKFTSDFTATANGIKTLTLQGSTAGTGEIAGAIVNSTGATSLTKSGTGTWTLSGTNTYTGATTVSNGTLNVSGSIASSATTVGSGATLALSGSGIAGAVTVNSGTFQLGTAGTAGAVTINDGTLGGVGTVNSLAFTGTSLFGPGNSPGTVTIANGGTFTLSAGTTSTFQFTDGGFGAGTFDLVTTPGTATGTIAGTLNLDFTGSGYTAGTSVTFINLTSISGTFSTVNVTGLTGLTATVNYDISGGDIYVSLAAAAVPEPSTYALVGGAAVLLFALRRRRSAGIT